MQYAPAEDRKGRPLHPGDRVRFKFHYGKTAEGTVVISPRVQQVMPDGSTLPALAIDWDGKLFSMPSPKGVLKIGATSPMPYSYDRTTATRLAKWHVENGKLKCDMEAHCTEPVTHIDQYGFLYCTGHAESVSRRKTQVRLRRITPSDIKKLLQRNPELVGIGRTAAWEHMPPSKGVLKIGATSLMAQAYPAVLKDIDEEYRRHAITRGERDELRAEVAKADSERDAWKIVEQHRKMRTAAQRVAQKFLTAAAKFPEVTKAIVAYFKNGSFKPHLKLKGARGDALTLVPVGLNDQVDRVEMTGLTSDKAKFVIHMKNGDSGWGWDEYRQPPQFHNDPGYNVLHLDRLAKYVADPTAFAQHMESFGESLAKSIQRAGWVIDPATKRPLPLAKWEEANKARDEAKARKLEEADRAREEAKAKAEATEKAEAEMIEGFRASIAKAVKRVAAGVKKLIPEAVVEYWPQDRIENDHRGISNTFWVRIEHPQVNPAYRPGIFFYWDKSKESGSAWSSSLVWKGQDHEGLPLGKMEDAMLDVADQIVADLKRQLDRTDSDEVWSVVVLGRDHGYATDVTHFSSKAKAEAVARDLGNCYVVKGTQMWNEPLGQVEEHDREAPYRFFK